MVTEMMMSVQMIPVGLEMEATDEERAVGMMNGEEIVVLLKEAEVLMVEVQGGGWDVLVPLRQREKGEDVLARQML